MDRATLLANAGNRTNDQGRGERVPLVATYHPALNNLGKVARETPSYAHEFGRHREVFPEPPLIAFRRCKNLKDILVRARLSNDLGNQVGGLIRRGVLVVQSACFKCQMSWQSEIFFTKSRYVLINSST